MASISQTESSDSPRGVVSPFDLQQQAAYRRWREQKLASYPTEGAALMVEIEDPLHLRAEELAALRHNCRKTNMSLYRTRLGSEADKDMARAIGRQCGLTRLDPNMLADDDGITSLQVVQGKSQRGYIPYSNRRLLWHTDGYYNPPQRQIRAMQLHTVQPAASGGINQLLDHEIVYLIMRDTDPAMVAALMQPDAMTIPANIEAEGVERPAQSGPVFAIDDSGSLHMRYTARTRSIEWKADDATQAAVAFLTTLLEGDSPYILTHRFAAGEGVLCNNVLHNRSGFEDDDSGERQRLVYRARYYDRVAGTAYGAVVAEQGRTNKAE